MGGCSGRQAESLSYTSSHSGGQAESLSYTRPHSGRQAESLSYTGSHSGGQAESLSYTSSYSGRQAESLSYTSSHSGGQAESLSYTGWQPEVVYDKLSACRRVAHDPLVQRQVLELARTQLRDVVDIVADDIRMIGVHFFEQVTSGERGRDRHDAVALFAGDLAERYEEIRGRLLSQASDADHFAIPDPFPIRALRIDRPRPSLGQIGRGVVERIDEIDERRDGRAEVRRRDAGETAHALRELGVVGQHLPRIEPAHAVCDEDQFVRGRRAELADDRFAQRPRARRDAADRTELRLEHARAKRLAQMIRDAVEVRLADEDVGAEDAVDQDDIHGETIVTCCVSLLVMLTIPHMRVPISTPALRSRCSFGELRNGVRSNVP